MTLGGPSITSMKGGVGVCKIAMAMCTLAMFIAPSSATRAHTASSSQGANAPSGLSDQYQYIGSDSRLSRGQRGSDLQASLTVSIIPSPLSLAPSQYTDLQ